VGDDGHAADGALDIGQRDCAAKLGLREELAERTVVDRGQPGLVGGVAGMFMCVIVAGVGVIGMGVVVCVTGGLGMARRMEGVADETMPAGAEQGDAAK
jgi:hypothetical protein